MRPRAAGRHDCHRWNPPPHRPAALWAGLILALLIVGCGGATKGSHAPVAHARRAAARPPSVCSPTAIAAVAGFLRVGASAVSTRVGTANSGAPECTFRVTLARGRTAKLWVSVDSSPQPYAVLERAAEEAQQLFAPTRLSPAPVHVAHLGLDAYWFAEENHVLTTDAVRLITATIVRWPGTPEKHWSRLAAAAARPYLGRSQPKLARGPAP
jgi:hypothetical protein